MHAVLNDEPEPSLRAGRLGAVLSGLLEKNPAKRLTADQAERMLRGIAEDRSSVPTTSQRTLPSAALPIPATSPPRKQPKEPKQRRDDARPDNRSEAPHGAAAVPPAEAQARDRAEALERVQSLKQAPAPRQAPAPEQARGSRPQAAEAPGEAARVPGDAAEARGAGAARGQDELGEQGQAFGQEEALDRREAQASAEAAEEAEVRRKAPAAPVQPVRPAEAPAPDERPEAPRPTHVPRPARNAGGETRPETRKRPYAAANAREDFEPAPVTRAEPAATSLGQTATSVEPPLVPMPPHGQDIGASAGRPLPIMRILLIAIPVILVVAGVAMWLGARDAADSGNGASSKSSSQVSEQATAPTASASASSPTASTSESASPAPTPEPTTSSPADVPKGWHRYKDRTGFSIALPKGWKRSEQRGTQVIFRGPDPDSYLLIDQTSSPKSDAKRDWEQQEPSARGRFPGYKLIQIKAVDYWKTAADWEFTFGGGRSHVINRGFVTDKDHGYAIYWKTAEKDWKKNLDLFHTFTATFTPAK
jgi:hypothetical protein